MAGAFDGYMNGVVGNIIRQKEENHAEEMRSMQGQAQLLSNLWSMSDVQNDPAARAQVLNWSQDLATGRAWETEKKRQQTNEKNGGPGHFHIIGQLLGGLHSTLAGPQARQLKPLDLGFAGANDLTSSSPQTAEVQGDKLLTRGTGAERSLAIPGQGVEGTFKTPEQQQALAHALEAKDLAFKRQQKMADLKSAGVDPTSQQGQEYLLKIRPTSHSGSEDPESVQQRMEEGKKLGLPEAALQSYAATGKLPTSFGKPVSAKAPTTTEIALQAGAERLGKPVDQLTGAEKVKAVRDFKAGTKIPSSKSVPATPAAQALVSRTAGQYVPGSGNSLVNPQKDQAIDGMAWGYIFTNHMPFIGMSSGKGGVNKREVAVGRAYELLADAGLNFQDLPAIQSTTKANQAALGQIVKMGASMHQFEETARLNMNLAQQLSDKYARSASPFINRVTGDITQASGDADVNNFRVQMRTLATEYSKIMSGATSASGAKITDTEEAVKFINGYLGKGQLSGLFSVMQQDFANRQQAVDDEKTSLIADLRGGLAAIGGSSTAASTPTRSSAPAAATTSASARAQNNQPQKDNRWYQTSASNPMMKRRSADGGKTWENSADGGKTWHQ